MPDILDSSVFTQVDANNVTGTDPSWPEGMAPNKVNDAARALQGAVTRWANWDNWTLSSTGSANAYVLTYVVPPAAYKQGQKFHFIANFANTGSATLNINSLGAKTIKRVVNATAVSLSGGEIQLGTPVWVYYNAGDDSFYWPIFDPIRTGTFTPGLTFGGAAVGMTGTFLGEHIQFERNMCAFSVRITLTAKGSSTGAAIITGLPFTADGSPIWALKSGFYSNLAGLTGGLGAYVSSTTLVLQTDGATGTTGLTEANFTNTSDFILSGVYKIA